MLIPLLSIGAIGGGALALATVKRSVKAEHDLVAAAGTALANTLGNRYEEVNRLLLEARSLGIGEKMIEDGKAARNLALFTIKAALTDGGSERASRALRRADDKLNAILRAVVRHAEAKAKAQDGYTQISERVAAVDEAGAQLGSLMVDYNRAVSRWNAILGGGFRSIIARRLDLDARHQVDLSVGQIDRAASNRPRRRIRRKPVKLRGVLRTV